MGTASYMSHEQARGKDIDERTDIWSLGVVIYEMLTHRAPFNGDSQFDIIASILRSYPPPVESSREAIPADLIHIVRKALRKDKEARYQTMKSVLADLRDVKDGISFSEKLERSTAPDHRKTTSEEPTALFESAATSGEAVHLRGDVLPGDRRRKQLAFGLVAAVCIFSILGAAYWFWADTSTTQIESIAVMPFVNESGNTDVEYLSDGISEALINSLTQLQQLKVIARSTAFRYKGKEVDPRAVGRDLKVRAVLMGRVRQIGDRLNVQVDLVDATTGAQLWGEEYERRVSDVLSVKQTIAREVTEKLRLRLSGEAQQQLVRRDTTNAESYQFYLRGRYFWNKRTADGIRKAIEEFQQAIDRDPNYALGYVGLADCYLALEDYAGVPASETLPKARAVADRALQIDDSLAEAHASSALIYKKLWRWPEAEAEYKRAISLNPNYPTAHHWFAIFNFEDLRGDPSYADLVRRMGLPQQ